MSICLGRFVTKGLYSCDVVSSIVSSMSLKFNIQIKEEIDLLWGNGNLLFSEEKTFNPNLIDTINNRFRRVSFGSLSKKDFILSAKHNLILLHTFSCDPSMPEEKVLEFTSHLATELSMHHNIEDFEKYSSDMRSDFREVNIYLGSGENYTVIYNNLIPNKSYSTLIGGEESVNVKVSNKVADKPNNIISELNNSLNSFVSNIDDISKIDINDERYNCIVRNLEHLYTVVNSKKFI